MKLVNKNISSYITTLSPKAKERLDNYLPKPKPWKKLLKTPHFVVYGLMRLGSIPPLTRIIHKPQAPTQGRTPPSDFGDGFEIVANDGGIYQLIPSLAHA